MNLNLRTVNTNSDNLLKTIKLFIDENKIVTWSYDKDGDFTHCADQWENKAWIYPTIVSSQEIQWKLKRPENQANLDSVVRSVYLGRFSEMLINHFENQIDSINIS